MNTLRPPLVVTLLLLVLPTVALAQVGATITGEVRDGTTNATIAGALVAIPSVQRAALTDATGSFTLVDVPEGTHEFVIHALGYLPLRQSSDLVDGDHFRIGMHPGPVVLDGVLVTAPQIDEVLQHRTMAAGVGVRSLPRQEIIASGITTADRYVQQVAMMVTCPSDMDMIGGQRACVTMRGRIAPVEVFINDERSPIGLLHLTTLHAEDLYAVEVWQNGAEIRVFTRDFMELVLAGRAQLFTKPPPIWEAPQPVTQMPMPTVNTPRRQ